MPPGIPIMFSQSGPESRRVRKTFSGTYPSLSIRISALFSFRGRRRKPGVVIVFPRTEAVAPGGSVTTSILWFGPWMIVAQPFARNERAMRLEEMPSLPIETRAMRVPSLRVPFRKHPVSGGRGKLGSRRRGFFGNF